MKKILLFALLALLLSGCGAEETLETISDELVQPVMAQRSQVTVELPGETAMPAMESDSGRMYLASDYEIYIETLEAGDLDKTIQTLSGFPKEDLTVMETNLDGVSRYEFVWSCAGEEGERIGRAVVLDDGNYHYTMTVLRDADTTETSQIVWNDVFDSFALVQDSY